MSSEEKEKIYRAKVNLETGRIPWIELQRFFAGGKALFVVAELDLVDVAYQISEDNAAQVQQWIAAGQLAQVTDEQAQAWYDAAAEMWAVAVSPWVLVQPVATEQ
jgi:hypothetical protein